VLTRAAHCAQIVLSKDLDGLLVTIPEDANNIFDPIPFQD
jgi:hypothetical protein